jgi:hypothetical protein
VAKKKNENERNCSRLLLSTFPVHRKPADETVWVRIASELVGDSSIPRVFSPSRSLGAANSHATPSAVLDFNIFASRLPFLLLVHRQTSFSYVTTPAASAGLCDAFQVSRGREQTRASRSLSEVEIERKIGAQTATAAESSGTRARKSFREIRQRWCTCGEFLEYDSAVSAVEAEKLRSRSWNCSRDS